MLNTNRAEPHVSDQVNVLSGGLLVPATPFQLQVPASLLDRCSISEHASPKSHLCSPNLG